MAKTFSITTAIDYTNSAPHIGHAYEKVLADVLARYHRLKGEPVFFLTGADQHGQKVQQSAAREGVPPAQFVKAITQKFRDLYAKLDVQYDEWAETIDPRHQKVVQAILQRLYDEKQIYKDKQSGHYSVRQEQFLTDKERGPDGEFGPEWGQVEFREEENYYFKLIQHKDWLLQYLAGRKDAVVPDFRQTELRNAVEKLSGDLCISRPKSRLDWGIELPFDRDYVTYVWFDALTNYISFAGYDPSLSTFNAQPSTFKERWSKDTVQVIGKDILVPAHGIYWLIMLHAIGFADTDLPQLLVHGFWNMSGAKMSKSLGNIVDPNLLADKYGPEAVRYYLMSDIATGKDADFSEERLEERYNSDLANSLGNLLNRTLNMAQKYRSGLVRADGEFTKLLNGFVRDEQLPTTPEGTLYSPALIAALEHATCVINATNGFGREMDCSAIQSGLISVIAAASSGDTLIERTAPWKLAKQSETQRILDTVLHSLMESLRIVAILISPILPRAAHGIFDQLNWKMDLSGKEERFSLKDAKWGGLPDGHVVGKPVPLFPRIEA